MCVVEGVCVCVCVGCGSTCIGLGRVLFVGGSWLVACGWWVVVVGRNVALALIYVCASKSNKMRNELISQQRCRLETKDILATATAIVSDGALWPLLCYFINGESLSLRPFLDQHLPLAKSFSHVASLFIRGPRDLCRTNAAYA